MRTVGMYIDNLDEGEFRLGRGYSLDGSVMEELHAVGLDKDV